MVKFNDLSAQWEVIKDDALPRINKMFENSARHAFGQLTSK